MGCSSVADCNPSMVTTSRWLQSTAYIRQLLMVLPSSRMVQAPHSPSQQAYLVPVRPSTSRNMARVVMVTGTVTLTGRPLSWKLISVCTDIIKHFFSEHAHQMIAIPGAGANIINRTGIFAGAEQCGF